MPTATTPKHKFANYLWDDEKAEPLTPAQRLVYRSNLLGSDQRITNTGGGNTSAKLIELDPISGEPVEVRTLAAHFLTESKDPRAIALLQQFVQDGDPQVREAARKHPNATVRARARELVQSWERRPLLRWH